MFVTYFKALLYTNPTNSMGYQNPMFEGFQRNPRISNPDNLQTKCGIGMDSKSRSLQIHSIPANQTGP